MFIIVPAGELFLPIALKIFPNLLPSTYEDQQQKDAKSKKLRTTRKDVSEFFRTTMKEGGILPIGPTTQQREEFAQFFRKVGFFRWPGFQTLLTLISRSATAASRPLARS